MVRTTPLPFVGLALFLGFCLGLAGCSGTPEEAPGKYPPAVTVSYPLQREVTDYQDFTGRTAAVDSVQVQARVTGYLDKIFFREGAEVKEGTVLYEIDPRPYKASYDAARAQVAENVANLALAKQNNLRFKKLARDQPGAVTQTDLDKYQSQQDQAVAALDKSRADLVTAKLNLDWTKVTAPVTGLIGRLLVTRGNLIVANQTTLTTVVAQDPMWVYFDMDEPTALKIRELVRQGKFGPTDRRTGVPVAKIPFRLQLANETDFAHVATFDFVNNQLDQATATLLIRGVFPNPKPADGPRVFTPNLFVRVRVPTTPPYRPLLVNAEAVQTDQHLKYVYVVDEHNKVVRHAVKLGSLQDDLQVIAAGLKPKELVIVSGMQRVHPGVTVNPRRVPMPVPTEGSLPPTPPPVRKAPAPSPKK
jgi:membrane fusion protein, multidrug efflux system